MCQKMLPSFLSKLQLFFSAVTCPSSPYHKQILGKCFYFEQNEMKWQEAQDNCRDKINSASGRLFEPRSTTMNLAVWKAADKLLGRADVESWLGITDLKDQGTYRYHSYDEEVGGMWGPGQPSGAEYRCVGYYQRSNPGKWYDLDCSWYKMSICEEGG